MAGAAHIYKIDPVKRKELVDIYIAGGTKAVRAKVAEYGVSEDYVKRAAVNMGLSRGQVQIRLDPRWARASAIGAIIA
jgi:hypothetical protein